MHLDRTVQKDGLFGGLARNRGYGQAVDRVECLVRERGGVVAGTSGSRSRHLQARVGDVVAGLGGRLITNAPLHRVLGDDSAPTVAQASLTNENPAICRAFQYRYGDSNPGFRRERAAS
jgi:hypothetical protein